MSSLAPLQEFEEFFVEVSELGRGRFGIVFEARHRREDGQRFAAKHIKARRREVRSRVLEEASILSQLSHQHVLRLEAVFASDFELILVTELLTGGELFTRVASDEVEVTETHCVNYMRQICRALAYLHSKHVVHLDLKPENAVFASLNSDLIKIIDFGLARRLEDGRVVRVMCGTPEFMAPEVVNYDAVTYTTDLWSVGVMCYVLLSGLSPFKGDTHLETLSNVSRAEVDFNAVEFDVVSNKAKNFIAKLLVKRPENRLSAEQCLAHTWLIDQLQGGDGHTMDTLVQNKPNLKRFLARRRWQKCGQAILAMARMSGLMRRRSSQTSDLIASLYHRIERSIEKDQEEEGNRSNEKCHEEHVRIANIRPRSNSN